MEEKSSDKILAFDTLFTTNSIQMLKVLITYLTPSVQKSFAVYIKLMELQYTITFLQNHPDVTLCGIPQEESFGMAKICDELLPLCEPSQKDKINQIKNIFQSFENMQEMMEMMQMMKELFPEGMNASDNNSDFLSALSGMSGMPNMPDFSGMDLSQIMGMLNN